MAEVQIKLAGVWVALELAFLYEDVLRIFSRDFPEVMNTNQITKPMWLGIAVLMSIPIIMILVSLILDHQVNRWANIIVAIFFFGFNLLGLPTYPSAYDRYLLIMSLGFNAVTIWLAWNWS